MPLNEFRSWNPPQESGLNSWLWNVDATLQFSPDFLIHVNNVLMSSKTDFWWKTIEFQRFIRIESIKNHQYFSKIDKDIATPDWSISRVSSKWLSCFRLFGTRIFIDQNYWYIKNHKSSSKASFISLSLQIGFMSPVG